MQKRSGTWGSEFGEQHPQLDDRKTTSFLKVSGSRLLHQRRLESPVQGRYLDRSYMFKTFGFYAQDTIAPLRA